MFKVVDVRVGQNTGQVLVVYQLTTELMGRDHRDRVGLFKGKRQRDRPEEERGP